MDLNRALTHTCFDRDANLEKALAAQRALVQAQEAHNEKLEQQVALLKEEEDKLRKDKNSEERDVKTQNLYMADNARLNAQMRLQMKAEKQQEELAKEQPDATRGGSELNPNARPLSLHAKGETNSASTAMQLASFAQGRDVEIPKAVLEKADAIVKHKVTTELAKRYESEINSDTSFIFSGPKSDEMLSDDANRATDASMITSPALLQQLAGTNRAPATAEGFGDIHDMERAVLTQLIQSNKEREQAAANKIAEAKAAAAEKQAAAAHALAVKKKLHLEAAQKIAQAKAATLANDRALKAAAAAAAAKKYAAEHKPLNKMSAQQRALAFVRAFDEVGGRAHTHTQSARLGDTDTDTDSGEFATKLSVGDEGGDSSAEWARNRLVAAGVANDGTSNL